MKTTNLLLAVIIIIFTSFSIYVNVITIIKTGSNYQNISGIMTALFMFLVAIKLIQNPE